MSVEEKTPTRGPPMAAMSVPTSTASEDPLAEITAAVLRRFPDARLAQLILVEDVRQPARVVTLVSKPLQAGLLSPSSC